MKIILCCKIFFPRDIGHRLDDREDSQEWVCTYFQHIYPISDYDLWTFCNVPVRKLKLTIKNLMVWVTVGKEAWNYCSVTQLKPLCEASETVLVVVRAAFRLSSSESILSNASTHASRSTVGKLGWGCCGLLRPGETYATVSMYTATAELVTGSPHVRESCWWAYISW